jgi:hypothetical protein
MRRRFPGLNTVLRCALLPILGGAAMVLAAQPHTNPRDPLVREAFQHFYDLDFPAAIQRFQQVQQAHPGDPQATAMLLEANVFEELYREDLLDTTFYANDGFLTGKHATEEDPAARNRIFALADQAVREADERLRQNPNDVDALYARGWARALRCAYVAMVERAYATGFRLATKAKNDEERVLELDPDYVDAKLVVGIYDYVVGALPFPFKILIGFVGITGSKSQGMKLLWDAADHGVASSVDARTVIALFLRREAKYKQAIQVVRGLEAQYPHDYLFALEEANLRKDAGEGMAAVSSYQDIVANAQKPGYYASAQLELTYFGLGDALRGQRHYAEAAQAYERAALTQNVSPELKIRSMLAAGQCHDLIGQRRLAREDYQMAIDAGPNTSRAGEARHYLRSPYTGV